MPAYLTHRVAGERVLDKLPGKELDEKAFYLGCQGPDMLFFRDFQPWRAPRKSLRIGLRMHKERVRELFETAFDYAREHKDDEEMIAYITGFITHYAIDKNTHPFVYGKAGRNTGTHNRIEFMWDSYAAKEQWISSRSSSTSLRTSCPERWAMASAAGTRPSSKKCMARIYACASSPTRRSISQR